MSANPLAFCSISALDRPLARVAELVASLGLSGIEVTARPPHLDPAQGPAEARSAARTVRAAGVEIVAYGSYLGRMGRVTRRHAEEDAAIAEALGAPLWRVWAEPLAPERGVEADRAAVLELLRAACDAARSAGICVVIERHIGSWADTPERCEALLDAVDRENVALNHQVLDVIRPEEVARQAGEAARLAPRSRYFHLKNFRPNPDPGGPLLPGGSIADGVLDYRAILASALGAGYRGPLTLEFLSMEPRPVEEKLAADAAFVRQILGELAG